jgi:transposase-like protein
MAKKNQKFRVYDLDFKNKVLKEYQEGASAGYLSQKYDIPTGTIFTWTTIIKKRGALGIAKRGRTVGLKTKDYKERYEILKKFRDSLVSQEQKRR